MSFRVTDFASFSGQAGKRSKINYSKRLNTFQVYVYLRYTTELQRNFLCHITDILRTFNDRRTSRNFHGFTELLQIHGSFINLRNFHEFTDVSRNFPGQLQ